MRIVAGGATVADSARAIALHETGEKMRVCVPSADVRLELLTAGARLSEKPLGATTA